MTEKGSDPSVLICEDDARFARALAKALASEGLDVRGVVGSAEQALDAVAREAPDVLLLDIELPGMSGLQAIAPLRARRPATEILVLTTFSDEERVFAAMCDGAAGYLLKRAGADEVARAVRDAHAGGSIVDPALARRFWSLLDGRRGGDGADPWGLTPDEREVLDLVARGLTNPEIGGARGTTRRAVKSQLESLYRKIGCHSRVEAVSRAVRAGLVKP